MSPWKIVLLIAALAGLLWFLAPQRAIAPNEPGVLGLYAFQVQVSIPGTAKGMGMVMAAALLMTLRVTLTGLKG